MTLLIPRIAQFALLLLSDENSTELSKNYDTTFFGLFNGMRPYNQVKPGGYAYASNSLINRPELDVVLLNAGVIICTKYSSIALFATSPKVRLAYDCVLLNSTAGDKLSSIYQSTNFTIRLVAKRGLPSNVLSLIAPYVSDTTIDFADIPLVNPPVRPISDFISLEPEIQLDSHQ